MSNKLKEDEKMNKHFKEFFVCPYCGKVCISREELLQYDGNYCMKYGKDITNVLSETLAEMNSQS